MESKLNFLIENKDHPPILADLFLSPAKKAPVVVYCHGYKGFKDWGHLPYIAPYFSVHSMHFLKFNFTHNGTSLNQPDEFVDLESFAENNYSRELLDVEKVIDYLFSDRNADKEKMDLNQVYLMGHSRGGGIAILVASKDKRIKKLVTWAAVSDFARRFPIGKAMSKWKEEGVFYIKNSRTKQNLPHNYQFYEDFVKNRERLDISEAERNLDIPHLLIHGTQDESVYLGEALHLMSLNEDCSLMKIKGGTHTLGAYHPYDKQELPHDVMLALNYTLTFLESQ